MLLRHRGRVQKGSVSALLSEGCEPFDKSGSGPTSLQIGLQTPHEHKQKEHSHAQNEDQEKRENTFPSSSRWHRQARSSLQTWCNGPCPSQESSRPCQGLPWSPR